MQGLVSLNRHGPAVGSYGEAGLSSARGGRAADDAQSVRRAPGSGFRVQGSGLRVPGSGFRVQGTEFRVQGTEGLIVAVRRGVLEVPSNPEEKEGVLGYADP